MGDLAGKGHVMTAIEILERAISKLETLSRGAREQGYLGIGEYQPWGGQNQDGDYAESILFDKRGETLVYGLPDGAGALIVALSRTVEPMLDVLGTEARRIIQNGSAREDQTHFNALDLARAILGEENDRAARSSEPAELP